MTRAAEALQSRSLARVADASDALSGPRVASALRVYASLLDPSPGFIAHLENAYRDAPMGLEFRSILDEALRLCDAIPNPEDAHVG